MSQVAVAAPWVKFDPITEDFFCERCRNRQPVRERFAETFIGVGERFYETHRTCRSREEMFPPIDRYKTEIE